MAVLYQCDGCAKPVENPAKVGHTVKRDYCSSCKDWAETFIEEEEKLRAETHTAFIDRRAMLIAYFAKDGFKLPDLPT